MTIAKRPSPVRAAGASKGGWLSVLEHGAKLMQKSSPLHGFDVYVVGFHCPTNEPEMQMEAHTAAIPGVVDVPERE